MRKWLISGGILIVLLLGCLHILKREDFLIIEGTVFQVNDSRVLLSQKKDISLDDLSKTYEEWMNEDYDLISVSNVEGVEVGMVLRVITKGTLAKSYPKLTQAKSYEILNHKTLEEPFTDLKKTYNQELLDIFPKTIGMNQLFNGYAEYGHFQTLETAKESGSIFQIIFNGMMTDGYGDSEERLFQLTYEITNQAVIEKIHNDDQYNQFNDSSLLNSIIPNKIVLKLPLEVGNSWFETFMYQGKEYTATTEIVQIEMNEDGKSTYETLTTVVGIEGDAHRCYKESRVFTTGSGLTSFSSLFSFKPIGTDNEKSEQAEEFYLFGYSLSAENIVIKD